MLGTLLVTAMALLLFGYVALPLVRPRQADPLPDWRDPLVVDLEEERDALFRAIRELDARADLPRERRDALRARYEAKAAQVLRALEERRAELAGEAKAPRAQPGRRRVPVAALGLLGLAVASATALGGFVLPRVEGGTVTAFFEGDLAQGRALRDLQRAAERDPSAENLLALGDAYWMANDAANAEETYRRLVDEVPNAPGEAYRRLGLLTLRRDLAEGRALLVEAASRGDLDARFALGEIAFNQGDMASAIAAWEAYLAHPDGAGDEQVAARLELARELAEPLAAVAAEPSEANLLALADVFWRHGERERAVEVYFRVLTGPNPEQPTALARTGQLLFTSGRVEDAVALLERARQRGAAGEALLFLGNGYFSQERYAEAIEAWEAYVADVGEARAGRAPDLIASARARLEGAAADGATGTAQAALSGAQVYAANCAVCHGAQGQGGSGPRLAGSARAADERLLRNVVRYGNGMMPGFEGRLSEAEIEAVVAFVAGDLARGEAAEAR